MSVLLPSPTTHSTDPMRIIRFFIRAAFTMALLCFVLGMAVASDPHGLEDLAGMIGFALFAGGIVSQHRRRSGTPEPEHQQPVAATPTAAVETVQADAYDLPGARGARMALAHQPADPTPPNMLAVAYQGETKAYVTVENWHPVGTFAELAPEDPEYRLVSLMSIYAQSVLAGPGAIYTEEDAIAYALGQLVPHALLERGIPNPAHAAEWLCIPVGVLTPQNLDALREAVAERNETQAQAHDWTSAE